MSAHRMVAPPSAIEERLASRLAKLAALASGEKPISDADFRKLIAEDTKRRLRAAVAGRLSPALLSAALAGVDRAVEYRGSAGGASFAIAFAQAVGVEVR